MDIENAKKALGRVKSFVSDVPASTSRTGRVVLQTSAFGYNENLLVWANGIFHQQRWIPSFILSFLKVMTVLKKVDKSRWAFMTGFEQLDAITPLDLETTYAKELRYWWQRFDELKSSTQGYVYGVISATYRLLSVVPVLFGVGGAVAFVYAFGLHWWWGILIYFGVGGVTLLVVLAISAVLLNVTGSRKLRGYADLLLVSSLLQVLRTAFQDNPESLVDKEEIEKRKEKIVVGIEESAKWLRCLLLPLPSKNKALESWYCAQMDGAASELLALRYGVVMSRFGHTEELRKTLVKYFDATFRQEYGNLLDKEIVPSSKTLLGKTGQVTRRVITVGSVVGFFVLLAIDLTGGAKLQLEAISGTGVFAALATIVQFTGGKRELAKAKAHMELFNHVVKSVKEGP